MSVELATDPFDEVIEAFRNGNCVILVDDLDRENEGDIAIATQFLTTEKMAFMMQEARGLICISLQVEVAERLNLPLQVLQNNSSFNTPFAISIDHVSVAQTGVTAESRAETMRALINPKSRAEDFISPGHVFPLIANPAGVIGRQGQTEGCLDLARIAGCYPSGVICEILNGDGTMARGEQLLGFARRFGLKITSVEDIIKHRIKQEILLRQVAEAELQTDFGKCQTYVFQDDVAQKEHLALVFGDLSELDPEGLLIRIHSECLTGDVFGSRRCDCGPQLQESMRIIAEKGQGMILYLRQEGRGIGLGNKLRAYELQDRGHDTVEANIQLGFSADQRDFAVAAKILDHFGQHRVRVLTNNPKKLDALQSYGIEVLQRLPVVVEADEYSRAYLETKRDKMGHWL